MKNFKLAIELVDLAYLARAQHQWDTGMDDLCPRKEKATIKRMIRVNEEPTEKSTRTAHRHGRR